MKKTGVIVDNPMEKIVFKWKNEIRVPFRKSVYKEEKSDEEDWLYNKN